MARIPNPVQIVGDNVARAGRARPGGQHVIGGAIVALGNLREPPAGPKELIAKALAPTNKISKMEIHNLSKVFNREIGQGLSYIEAQFNPAEFTQEISVNWNELVIPGMGHTRLQYKNTGNVEIGLELYFDASHVAQSPGGSGSTSGGNTSFKANKTTGSDVIVAAKNFLESLTVPGGDAQSVLTGAPPRVLFYWPNFMSLTCVVRGLSEKFTGFAPTGQLLRYTCGVKLQEIRDVRLTTADILQSGSARYTYPSEKK